jgi:hypothetical protein
VLFERGPAMPPGGYMAANTARYTVPNADVGHQGVGGAPAHDAGNPAKAKFVATL